MKPQVFFRYRCTLAGLGLGHEFTLEAGRRAKCWLTVRPLTDEEASRAVSRSDARAEIVLTRAMSSELVGMLNDVAASRMPAGSTDLAGEHYAVDKDGRIREGMAVPFELLPHLLKQVLSDRRREAYEFCRTALRTIRWRYNQPSPHNPIRNVASPDHWSLDGETWLPLPDNIHAGPFEPVAHLKPTENELGEIRAMLDAHQGEPLGHDLYLEAWHLRRTNPRSALVLCVAALETSVKAFIANLAPETAWLMEKIPSPPVVTLLREYVPILLRRRSAAAVLPVLPESLRVGLENAISLRNSVAHRGAGTINADELRETLYACRDVLWLLDYLDGREWAAEHIRPDARRELGIGEVAG